MEVGEGLRSLLPIGILEAMRGEHGVKGGRPTRQERAPDLGRPRRDGLRVELGRCERRRAGNGDSQVELALVSTPLGDIAVAGAEGRGRARVLLRRVALAGGQAADGVPLQPAVACGSRQLGHGRGPGRQAISQRQQRMPAKRHDARLFRLRQARRMRRLRPHRGIMARRPLLPCRAGFRMTVTTCSQRRETGLTLLDRSTHGRARTTAAVRRAVPEGLL